MDRRNFCKMFFLSPFFAPYLNVSKHIKRGFELQLITSSPHKFIAPLLEEVQKRKLLAGRNFTILNHHPYEEELKRLLSKNHWNFVLNSSCADLVFTFCYLSKSVPSSFTLIKNEKVWDIRSKNLLPLWQEMSRNHRPSNLLTIVSPPRRIPILYRGTLASVYLDGKKINTLSLKKSYSKTFTTRSGKIEVLIEKSKARVVNSSCRHKICLRTPPIAFEGERIVCAPNHFLLKIESHSFLDAVIG